MSYLKKFLTLIIPTVPLYSNQFESHIPMIHNNNFIFNPCFKIIDHLNDNIKNNDLSKKKFNNNI